MDRRLRSCVQQLGMALVLLAACVGARAADLNVTIDGLDGALEDAARASLSLSQQRDPTPAQIRRLFADGKTEIRTALEPYGYYNARVDGNLERTEKGFAIRYRVRPGDPTVVGNRTVQVRGDGAKMSDVDRALRRFAPRPGERFDHALYEQSKANVESALSNDGFLRATATSHRVEVSRKANVANINLAWQSGPRMRFGPVRFSESQFTPHFLERYVPWQPGDYYSPDELLAFQQKLIDADYFATVMVQPDLSNKSSVDVPIDVQLAPAKRSVYTAGVYMSTDTGPGVRVGLNRRWLNHRGHKADVNIDYAQRLSAIATGYHIPLAGPNERSYNFGATYRDENTTTSVSRTERIAANETRRWHNFTRTLGMQFVSGNFEIADEQRYSTLLFAEGTLSRKQADDFFFPRRGYSMTFGTRFAPEGLLGDTSFSQVTADGRWIHSAGRRQRVLLRASLGLMAVDDFNQLPPELRFFAGGDRSVRGFDYQELGATNADGQVIGGQYLTVASAEFERYFLRNWGAAVFVDAGDAFLSGSSLTANVGAGVGIRWRSPVGIVRLDIAKPVVSDLADQFRFHITIGPDL
jgi:translocation and assembly module TamA